MVDTAVDPDPNYSLEAAGHRHREAIALIPAAGLARRLDGVAVGSKELLTVCSPIDGSRAPAIVHLLRALALATVAQAVVFLRRGKWDLPEQLGAGEPGGPLVTYLVVEPTPAVPHTLACGLGLAAGRPVVLGFPDILLAPADAFARVLDHYRNSSADVVLGLFPTQQATKTDMVDRDETTGQVRRLVIKQPDEGLHWTWSLAAWGPRFSTFLAAQVTACPSGRVARRELYVGDVLSAAMASGMRIATVPFANGSYLDIGTPDDLARAR